MAARASLHGSEEGVLLLLGHSPLAYLRHKLCSWALAAPLKISALRRGCGLRRVLRRRLQGCEPLGPNLRGPRPAAPHAPRARRLAFPWRGCDKESMELSRPGLGLHCHLGSPGLDHSPKGTGSRTSGSR